MNFEKHLGMIVKIYLFSYVQMNYDDGFILFFRFSIPINLNNEIKLFFGVKDDLLSKL